jgi:hypothetical protein
MAKTNKSAGGIGESRNFGAPEETRLASGVDRILKCHINGVAVAEMNLGPEVLSALSYGATDEGIAEFNARPDVREPSGVSLGKDEFAKSLDQRRDDVKVKDMPLFDARNPLLEVAEKFKVAGMKPKFLSAARVKDEGSTGIYEVVKKENGDPVKVKGMILGHAPEDVVKARNAHYQKRGNQMLQQVVEKHKQENGADLIDPGSR